MFTGVYIHVYSFFKLLITKIINVSFTLGFPGSTMVKNLPASPGNARDMGSILGSGSSPGGGKGNPLQCSCLGNPMDRGAWQASTVCVVVAKSQT